jgi:DNA-binding HxlR family transcriptional regulator
MLRILWELREDRLTFRVLRARCGGISPSVLNRRIRELREAGIVEPRPANGYRLTEEGRSLLRALRSIGQWAERRARLARRPRRTHPESRAK